MQRFFPQHSSQLVLIHAHLPLISKPFIQQNKLREKMLYVKIDKGMYGLPHVGILANELLKKHLPKH